MEIVDFYCFSGTGNTYLLVKKMQETFTEHNIKCQVHYISSDSKPCFNTIHTLGLAFPIACSSTYPVVWKFIDSLPTTNSQTQAFLLTSFAGQDGAISAQIYSVLKRKGYQMTGYSGVLMPNNFLIRKINRTHNEKLITNGKIKVKKFAENLIAGKADYKIANRIRGMFGKIAATVFLKTGFFQKLAKIKIDKNKCTECGICAKICPVENITIIAGKPTIGDHCQECMRCLGYCPSEAIKLFWSIPYKACSYNEFTKELNG